MTVDGFSTPLGQKPLRKSRQLPFSPLQVVVAAAGAILLAFASFALFVDDPFGGEPMVRLALKQDAAPGAAPAVAKANAPTAPAAASPASPTPAPAANAPAQRTVTIIDGSSGKREDVVVSDKDPADNEAAASAKSAYVDPRLLGKSLHGAVPIATDNLKPFTAYAEGGEELRARASAMPVIAVIVGGLGVGAARTADAIAKLPGAITLAFTPYGSEPGKFVERARAAHHEVLLQIPMEPFDYPDNDPGPQTLLTTIDPEQNLDRLMWHLSRIQGYVGVTSFMGARFVATDVAMKPVIREAAKRGLGFFDDGRAPRSVAGPLAESAAMPFARADVAIDAVPTAAEIDRGLAKLEAQAKERGVAIGVAGALPISIERIGLWARQLEGRGVLLVPLTTATLKSKSS